MGADVDKPNRLGVHDILILVEYGAPRQANRQSAAHLRGSHIPAGPKVSSSASICDEEHGAATISN